MQNTGGRMQKIKKQNIIIIFKGFLIGIFVYLALGIIATLLIPLIPRDAGIMRLVVLILILLLAIYSGIWVARKDQRKIKQREKEICEKNV